MGYNPVWGVRPGQINIVNTGRAQIPWYGILSPYSTRHQIPYFNPLAYIQRLPRILMGQQLSYRPASVTTGRNIQPIARYPNIFRPVSYYNPTNTGIGRRLTNPQISLPNYNFLSSFPWSKVQPNPYLQVAADPRIRQGLIPNNSVLHSKYWRYPYQRGSAVPGGTNMG